VVSGFWPVFFLLVVLKIPVLGGIWLVWWASREPEPEGATGDEGGGFRRRPQPRLPRGPRRGPHGGGAALPIPDCPPGGRTRVVRPASRPALARAGSRAGEDRVRPAESQPNR